MMDDRREALVRFRVGAFVLAALAVFLVLIYMLGARARLFENRYTVAADFTEVGGLVEGATVRLAGVQIGRVSAVRLPAEPGGKVRVEMRIASRYANRIREDSVARIETQGLLGDRIIEITVGSAAKPPVKPGGLLAAGGPADFGRVVSQGAQIVGTVTALSENLNRTAQALSQSQVVPDLAAAAAAARRIAEQVERGPGLAHALLYQEPAALEKLDRLLGSTQTILDRTERGEGALGVLTSRESTEAARRFVRALDRLSQALDQKAGDGGLLPALLFDPKYRALLDDVRGVARNLRDVSGRLASGHGFLGELIGDESPDAGLRRTAADLQTAIANLKEVSEKLNSGRGTLGALLVDPTVYENLAAVLEGTRRSTLLRSLIRGLGERGREADRGRDPDRGPR